eukprot:TRINITY_DN4850_c0_g1_i1.p1 TRINITY_DN4850_c0_g1~~TRINITY_DN4850_c0_g1_i1.p1  ORF type:complete len:113 (+),score=2.75 TRINITY_DN4850_c0_g1_i1:927-1265(+)
MIWKREEPMTTKMKSPNTQGATGYCVPFFILVSGTLPRLCTFLSNLAIFRSAKRREVVIVINNPRRTQGNPSPRDLHSNLLQEPAVANGEPNEEELCATSHTFRTRRLACRL